MPDSATQQVAIALSRNETRGYFPRRAVEALLQAPPEEEGYQLRVDSVIEWVAEKAGGNALAVLGILERLADGFEDGRYDPLYKGQELVAPLTAMLREADETDDPDLIARVVTLQDRFLQLGVTDVDQMLDAASRP